MIPLPLELLELQLAQIDLLLAMYPEPDTVLLDEEARTAIDLVREQVESGHGFVPTETILENLIFTLMLDLENGNRIQLSISIAVTYTSPAIPSEPPASIVKLKQPSWLSKAQVQAINASIPTQDDMLSQIEYIKDAVSTHLPADNTNHFDTDNLKTAIRAKYESDLVRVWFYFPSISTREKRQDIITHAPSYNLTGFLLAGKPGLLCLEGQSKAIDEYMKFIKTESWGDIPAHQKKVSERLREDNVDRKFEGMREVTDEIGERRGERANRTDMRALEAWLTGRGFGEVMKKVVI